MGSMNQDIKRERDTSTIDPSLLTPILDGGIEKTNYRHYIEKLILGDPMFDEKERYLQGPEEKFDNSVRRSLHLSNFAKKHNLKLDAEDLLLISRTLNSDMALTIHHLMFMPTIERLGTDEQKSKWMQLAKDSKIIGTYAQTELGHGTYLGGLETTATYDPSRQEFVLNSPTLTSMKWWPGGLGLSCNYCVLLAKLLINGKDYGPHAFLVQIRNLQDHTPLRGRTVGDIGLKWDYNTVDNGFLRLHNVRIPRQQMLMKYAKVAPDGTYSISGNIKVTYGTMIAVRLTIIAFCYHELARALTIAVRYSAIRRQAPLEIGGEEVQILDYQTQQQKLLPGIATAYAFCFVHQKITKMYHKMEAEIHQNNFQSLPELHALCCGLKSFCTGTSSNFINICRFACGGQGLLMSSGLPSLYARFSASCTYEGENTVMMLQLSRYLLKCLRKSQEGEVVAGSASYLSDTPGSTSPITSSHMWTSLPVLLSIFKNRSYKLVMAVGQKMAGLFAQGKSPGQAWNGCLVDLVNCGEAHMQYFVLSSFVDSLQSIKTTPTIQATLTNLCCLFGLYYITQHRADFMIDGYLTQDQIMQGNEEYLKLLAAVRPEAVSLVDAFDYRDECIHSTLGCYDGNAYQRLYEFAKKGERNKSPVHETYHKYLVPLMRGHSKL
ncbi:peroxisomal acyl-coenzyme A oxidase 1-like [Anneissia japonica]|uniref:peroxisomal acyl-coenzyme A oxidase 1-like n=1 Tax=Anneissia japonica TaxID=1529436 RepID=UPI0014258F69|nr:peroxisomal acyl-coenzyme A oxidase 1-like [Anneissia japonica]